MPTPPPTLIAELQLPDARRCEELGCDVDAKLRSRLTELGLDAPEVDAVLLSTDRTMSFDNLSLDARKDVVVELGSADGVCMCSLQSFMTDADVRRVAEVGRAALRRAVAAARTAEELEALLLRPMHGLTLSDPSATLGSRVRERYRYRVEDDVARVRRACGRDGPDNDERDWVCQSKAYAALERFLDQCDAHGMPAHVVAKIMRAKIMRQEHEQE